MTPVATTLDHRNRARWAEASECLVADAPAALVRAWRIVRAGMAGRTVVVNGFSRADLAAVAALRLVPNHRPVIVTDATWEALGPVRVDRALTRVAVSLVAHCGVHFCASSRQEARIFNGLWGIRADRTHVLPWYHHAEDDEDAEPPVGHDGPVFAGGKSLRDYDTFLRACALLDQPVLLAAPGAHRPRGPVPPNVTVQELTHPGYEQAVREARVVVVPLQARQDRSAGQGTYLTAMALGKAVVVTDTLAVREHVTDGHDGIVVPPGDAVALAGAIAALCDPGNARAVGAMRERARRTARGRFGPNAYIDRLLAIVADVQELEAEERRTG